MATDTASGGILGGLNTVASVASALIAAWVALQTMQLKVQQAKIETAQGEIKTKQEEIKTAQAELERRAKVEGLTQTFIDKVSDQLKQLDITDHRQRDALIIDMVDIITQVNASESGVLDAERRSNMPLRVALLAGNDETLAHIGGTAIKRKTWVKLARASASPRVRQTAIAALGDIARVTDSEDMPGVVADTLELADHLRNDDVMDASLGAIQATVDVMAKDPGRFREEEPVRTLLMDLRNLTVSASRSQAERHAESNAAATADIVRRQQRVDKLLAQLERQGLVEPTAVATAPPPARDVPGLLRGLVSDVAAQRRTARTELAASGTTGVPALANSLRDARGGADEYRVKIGVATALYQMEQPVVVAERADAESIVELLGDPDPLVRKYAAEFLMKLSDRETVARVHGALTGVLESRTPEKGTAVYNAVVVLGTWLRILPAAQDDERARIRTELQALRRKLPNDGNWVRTQSLIDELLKAAGTPAASRLRS